MTIELIECKPYEARLTERACKLRRERALKLARKPSLHPDEGEIFRGMAACLDGCERATDEGRQALRRRVCRKCGEAIRGDVFFNRTRQICNRCQMKLKGSETRPGEETEAQDAGSE
ncbi:MAG: hypothetical protein HS130_01025 [Deltaproteobacteria bacterium]|nr:hypothetical protein [Deltaproteobacteria bacterium]MCL4873831.1 hypothetical protein [bacterium]